MEETVKKTKRGRRTRPALEEAKLEASKLVISHAKGKIKLEDLSAEELHQKEASLFKLEWVFHNKGLAPQSWLQEEKKKTPRQALDIVTATGGAASWYREKDALKDSVTETLVKRHVDLVAETQENHIKGSQLTLAMAMDMLANGPKTKDGKDRMSLRSVDLLNCATAIEKAQKIYRTAIGFGDDEGGLKQILEAIQRNGLTQVNIQNNTTINEAPSPDLDLTPEERAKRDKIATMSYEDLTEIIEFRREQRKKREEEMKAKKEGK